MIELHVTAILQGKIHLPLYHSFNPCF